MDIIISGYGRMGKEVEKICRIRNHNIIAFIDNEKDWANIPIKTQNVVIIDFSLPDVVLVNLSKAFDLGIPIVTGTTGWHDNLEVIKKNCNLKNGTLFYAPNFSIGVNIFQRTNAFLAKLMSNGNNYSVRINETHHIHKVDAPSGTAIATADGIINNNPNVDLWSLDDDKQHKSVPIFATREGEVTGKHDVIYESGVDKISLSHEAKNRGGFALGAVLAAEFIVDKKGVFTMDDLLDKLI